jgi:hypothetical protein
LKYEAGQHVLRQTMQHEPQFETVDHMKPLCLTRAAGYQFPCLVLDEWPGGRDRCRNLNAEHLCDRIGSRPERVKGCVHGPPFSTYVLHADPAGHLKGPRSLRHQVLRPTQPLRDKPERLAGPRPHLLFCAALFAAQHAELFLARERRPMEVHSSHHRCPQMLVAKAKYNRPDLAAS